MILPDVNVLVLAHREDQDDHEAMKLWLEDEVNSERPLARANLIPDAHLAALATENGATVATRDRGFARFREARWIDPLAEPRNRPTRTPPPAP